MQERKNTRGNIRDRLSQIATCDAAMPIFCILLLLLQIMVIYRIVTKVKYLSRQIMAGTSGDQRALYYLTFCNCTPCSPLGHGQ